MNEYEHRLIVALERLAGRDDGPAPGEVLLNRLDGLLLVLEDIRSRMPPAREDS